VTAAPLSGLRVLELSDDIALAFCGKYLAALGAEVTLSTPGLGFRQVPDAMSDYLDHGKLVGASEGEHADYDIVLETASTALGSRSQEQIRVLISDFGTVGPDAGWKGTELTLQAAGGLLALVGDRNREPLQLGGHQVAYSAGSLAFTGAMTALAERDRSGVGQDVIVSGLETVAYLEWKGRVYDQVGTPLSRGERSGPMIVHCSDGHFGFYYRSTDWKGVLSVFDDERLRAPEFADHPSRIRHRDALKQILESILVSWTKDDLYRALQAAGVPAGPVCTPTDLMQSPQYRHRDFLVPGPGGGVMPALPVRLNGRRPEPKPTADATTRGVTP
jgi:crotonobetainyl-CoA:carnitine CoA-transferase CaiB-like acyl-CoA transferase